MRSTPGFWMSAHRGSSVRVRATLAVLASILRERRLAIDALNWRIGAQRGSNYPTSTPPP